MSILLPPLPCEPLISVAELAHRADCSCQSIYNAIADRRLAAVLIGNRRFIAESEAQAFLREWPTKNRGVSARWREYREWKAAQRPAGEAA